MPPKPFLDFDFLKRQDVKFGSEEIRQKNPQRHEMEQLTAVVYLDMEEKIIAGFKDVTDREFWVRGHLPGRPIFPGVLMVEAGAQLGSFFYHMLVKNGPFFGFGGIDGVRFRGTVAPGQRLYLVAKAIDLKPSRGYFQTQGIVNGKTVFEGKILGLAMR